MRTLARAVGTREAAAAAAFVGATALAAWVLLSVPAAAWRQELLTHGLRWTVASASGGGGASELAIALPESVEPAPQAEIDAVLAFVQTMQVSDVLVEVRSGVLAKRSNVEGVRVGQRTLYYDVFPDQSFGPLRSGRWNPGEVRVLARISEGDTLVLIYERKGPR